MRQPISTFARHPDHAEGLARLAAHIASGECSRRNQAILDLESLDAGYRIVSAKSWNTAKHCN